MITELRQCPVALGTKPWRAHPCTAGRRTADRGHGNSEQCGVEMKNANLNVAKRAKNDEFYTQWRDIELEMNAYLEHDPDVFRGKTLLLPCDDPQWSNFTKYFASHFHTLGLAELISTSYQPGGRGKVYTLTGVDATWQLLDGDGDFRSAEVTALRDRADMVVTNPPFSLFREFVVWLEEGGVQYSIIGNVNAITYKVVFPLIHADRLWLGPTISSGDREFRVPDDYSRSTDGWRIDEHGNKFIRVKGVRWFTNIPHRRRHGDMSLMTMADNLRYSRRKTIRERGYPTYDNCDAIEVAFTEAIPADYPGVMGVPITFLDRYNPDQFEILGCSYDCGRPLEWDHSIRMSTEIGGVRTYKRLFIRHRKPATTLAVA